jgi:hypothetical protein
MSYTKDKKMFAIKNDYNSCSSCVDVERQYRREFSVCIAPSGATICRTVRESQEVGSVLDRCAKGRKRSASVPREKFVGVAWEAITKSRRKLCDI